MESIYALLPLLELMLICTCVSSMEAVGEACEQQHDGIECADSFRAESKMYTSIQGDTHAHKFDITVENIERHQ